MSYCQIYLFASRPAQGNAMQSFVAEWMRLVAQPFHTTVQPQVETKVTPDGWSAVTGSANVTQRGVPSAVILFTATGFGKEMSIVFNLTDQAFIPDIKNFLSGLSFNAGGPVAQAPQTPGMPQTAQPPAAAASVAVAPRGTSGPGVLSDYLYSIPQGWTGTQYPDGGTVYGSQMYSNGERCQISVFPMRRGSGNLFADARQVYASIFQMDPLQDNAYPYPVATLTRGIAAEGWQYVIIQRSIHGRVGEYGTLLGTRILAAQLGQQIGIITATGKDPLVSMCFGELVHDDWPEFFFTIGFKSWTPQPQDAQMPRRIAGTWTVATATVADQYTFAPNGRYASAAAAMTRTRVSLTEILETTNAYFGDGSYTISGNTMVMKADRGTSHTVRFRLEQDSKDGGATWTDRLCLLEAGIGDVCYKRDQ